MAVLQVSSSAMYMFPLAHAAVVLAGGSIMPPECFTQPLLPLPPLSKGKQPSDQDGE